MHQAAWQPAPCALRSGHELGLHAAIRAANLHLSCLVFELWWLFKYSGESFILYLFSHLSFTKIVTPTLDVIKQKKSLCLVSKPGLKSLFCPFVAVCLWDTFHVFSDQSYYKFWFLLWEKEYKISVKNCWSTSQRLKRSHSNAELKDIETL